MPNPLDFNDKFESLFQTEILTYLSLKDDIQTSARRVSKSWKQACEAFKTSWIEKLDAKSKVVLLELNSAKGKTLNGNIVHITGARDKKSHRYPIRFENWLTGESETLTIKICNLNPTATKHKTDLKEDSPNLIQYTTNAKLRRSHGMMLDQMLMLARWESNNINGRIFRGDYMEFANLPRGHPVLGRLNANMWTWWAANPKLAGISTRGTISDMVARSIIDNDPSRQLAREDKLWPQDGPAGSDLAQNLIRFMKTWATDRVTGDFFVSHRYKTGSIMTSFRDGKFGQVYLVRGHNSVIAEMGPLPLSCRATLLPIYDCWTYDGIIIATPQRLSVSQKKALDVHVQKAIIDKGVSWRGPRAKTWKYPPPPFPTIKIETDDETILDWSSHVDDYTTSDKFEESDEITTEHINLGRKIVQAALVKGGFSPTTGVPESHWIIRRLGYSYEENPQGMALIMCNSMPLGQLSFEVDHVRGQNKAEKYIPTYNLMELLRGILDGIEMAPLAPLIQPDELAVVRPLQQVLKQCFEEKGETAPDVHWYPPASEEEAVYASAYPNPEAAVGRVAP